jgi:hypothetical protein
MSSGESDYLRRSVAVCVYPIDGLLTLAVFNGGALSLHYRPGRRVAAPSASPGQSTKLNKMNDEGPPRHLPERTGRHRCIHCLKEIPAEEYFAGDFVCLSCAERFEQYPLASTPGSGFRVPSSESDKK